MRTRSVQEVVANAEMRVYARIKTDFLIQHNRPDILVHDKKRKEITLIEVGITNFDLLSQVENEKLRKYDLVTNELSLMHKRKVKIYLGVVKNYTKSIVRKSESN